MLDNETIARCDNRVTAGLIFRAVTSGKFLDSEYVDGLLGRMRGEW